LASFEELLRTNINENPIVSGFGERQSRGGAKGSTAASTRNEADLERALWFLYQQWKQVGFRPRGFYEMFTPHCKQYRGGIAAIQTIFRQGTASGFEYLNHRGKRELSIESLVLREAWAHLFNDGDKRIAQQRLDGIAKLHDLAPSGETVRRPRERSMHSPSGLSAG
jgi:hypothetical protein